MDIEKTKLYQELRARIQDVPAGPDNLLSEFESLRTILKQHSKYIVLLFPEYTPHDHSCHLDNLFTLADRLLGPALYERLASVELFLLAFSLYAHDWGMAVSEAERQALLTPGDEGNLVFLPDEPVRFQSFVSSSHNTGKMSEVVWREYVRSTHGLRSGARLRKQLAPLGAVFAETVAKIAEGHTMSLREVRDPARYPQALSVFGESVNVAAIATYVRMLDLLDVGENRTPYALWTFVSPADPMSSLEWQKHRALSPVAVKQGSVLREVLISGQTDDHAVFASLNDLRSWIDEQFAGSIAQLRMTGGKYDIDLDSRITWNIEVSGFKPVSVRFELDRREVMGLLSSELYKDDTHAFVRELLQNSVDAIDMREALLAKHGLALRGEIHVRLAFDKSSLCIEWRDNGIGMDEDALVSYFARPGQCWYRSQEASRVAQIDAVSRFGIGVLSFFAVSETLTIETLRDPLIGGPQPGLVVEIPARDSHFRIRTAPEMQVGTTLHLRIPPHLCTVISKESVRVALERIARYVRHRIIIDCDGVSVEAGLRTQMGSTGSDDASRNNLDLELVGMQGDSAVKLADMTTISTFEVGELGGSYYGHYSAVVPKRPAETRTYVDSSAWSLEGTRVDLDDVLTNSEEALFVKGIQAGPVAVRAQGRWPTFSRARHSYWIKPKLLLNMSHPSDIGFNLARSAVHLKSSDSIEAAWREIASSLRKRAFDWPVTCAADLAVLLGSIAVFGAVPDCGLDALVEVDECPLLVLQAEKGPAWVPLSGFVTGEDFVDAPFELGYTQRLRDSLEIGQPCGLEGWEGEDALFPLAGLSSYTYPWLSAVIAFGYRLLGQRGWYPSAIRLVRAPDQETVPLVCRVWRKAGATKPNDVRGDEGCLEGHGPRDMGAALRHLYREAPEVVQFSDNITQYAALGSRYWNIEHPKIKRILETLTRLVALRKNRGLSTDGERMLTYLTSNKFYGYVVPARFSSIDLALEVPNRLLEITTREGLPSTEPLVAEDFVAESIGKYQNPYHYDIREWKKPGTGLGKRLV